MSPKYYKKPKTRPWVEAEFNMDKGTLTVKRYDKGELTDSVTVKPKKIPTSKALNPGAVSGNRSNVDMRNESQYQHVPNKGPIPLGNYTIKLMSEEDPGARSYMDRYREHGVKEPWYMLDKQDKGWEWRDEDHTLVKDPNTGKLVDRSGFRLHMGRGSAGCISIWPNHNQKEWMKIEELIPDGAEGEVVGQLVVTDSNPGPGNETFPASNSVDMER